MDYIIAKKDRLTRKLHLSEIFYIGTKDETPRILQFVTDEGVYEAYGRIKEFESGIGLTFMRCHRKYLVNLRHIKAIDGENRQIIFDSEKVSSITCSRRSLSEVTKVWKNF